MRPDLKELLLRDDGSGTLLYMRLYKGMREAFSRGLLQPGERLPTDMEMARELGVNHLTLKKTLCRLAKEGFLTRQRGRGTAVAAVLPAAAPFQAGSRVTVLLDAVSEATLRSDTFVSICKGVNALGMTIELVSTAPNWTSAASTSPATTTSARAASWASISSRRATRRSSSSTTKRRSTRGRT